MATSINDSYLLSILTTAARNLKHNTKFHEVNFNRYNISFNLMSDHRPDYRTNLFKVNIYNTEERVFLRYVLKKSPDDACMTNLREALCYNEIYFYSKIYPKLRLLEDQFQICTSLIPVPEYIMSDTKAKNVYLRDLSFDGFKKKSDKPLDEEHFHLIFRAYGYLHAISICLKNQNFEEFQQIIKLIKNVVEANDFMEHTSKYVSAAVKNTLNILDSLTQQHIVDKLQTYLGNEKEILQKSTRYQGIYGCLLHGYSLVNNMMFKYNSFNQVEEVKLLDFRHVRYGSPVHDLSEFFYRAAAEAEVHLLNLDTYLKSYYDSFSVAVQHFNEDPNQLLPYQKLLEEWKIYAKPSMLLALGWLNEKYIGIKNAQNRNPIEEQTELFTFHARTMMQYMFNTGVL